jgi:poly-beta-1,6-N-acetyl-D-glucosamine synthase
MTSIDGKKGNKIKLTYVCITPARNESRYIEKTIKSMLGQTILPLKWIVVSDGSTDGTDGIVAKYLSEHNWIQLITLSERKDRHFAGKVRAFNAGYDAVKNLDFNIIANVDGDISFGKDHFEFLLNKFAEDPFLGVAGTAFVEGSSVAYNYKYTNIEHVSGQCQVFRRRCFDEIGGYVPIKGGGVDWTAVTTARMMGWHTRTFAEKTFSHHRIMGTGTGAVLSARFRFGMQDYYLGGHPVWEVFRCIYQMSKSPIIVGGCCLFAGYVWALITRNEKPISKELVEFHRKEQINKLKTLLKMRTIG